LQREAGHVEATGIFLRDSIRRGFPLCRRANDPRRPDVIADRSQLPGASCGGPRHWSDSLGGWVLTRYDDVKNALLGSTLLADRITPFAEHLTARLARERREPGPGARRLACVTDPPKHTRSRRHEYRVYLGADREPEPIIQSIVDRLLDSHHSDRATD